MKQDIRDLFKDDISEEKFDGKRLPKQHREEFIAKLKASRRHPKHKLNKTYVFKLVAMLVVFLGLAYALWPTENQNTKFEVVQNPSIEAQVKRVETRYLESIDQEWQRFIALAKDEQLIERYRKKLEDLNVEYQNMTKQFEANQNNVNLIESLVANLQTRLRLLKEIQEHILVLNKKNTTDEAIL